ncbi:MAG TPA: hypothetical protein VN113_01395 [Caulobacter sp.]|nr:hypothetical protein [Caulobacter sp.]
MSDDLQHLQQQCDQLRQSCEELQRQLNDLTAQADQLADVLGQRFADKALRASRSPRDDEFH